ncbi:hypothetical protein FCU45_00945 [Sulfurimonas crateris]|uniref:VCBS repeat-containing protein n=1 Tax=Sulfurimonas crateris TaxID=2574727 RepID=A0A4U2Z942_9BACT|nr:hypothetical protein [Sulfurimonas crateris]TKI70986.1 hypothetical protein FCU45_00945 [Sulfurimonas crateris]
MKIENFVLDLHSESSRSSSSTVTTFSSELQNENSKRLKEVEALNSQVAFCKRLEFELIQQLIFRLNSKTYKFKAVDASDFTKREVSVHEEYRESQRLDVSMQGFIYTSNRRIELNMDISMSHSFVSNHEIIRQQFYDPLVLNFDGELPDLDSTNFSFDIDANGECDQISTLKKGSGFLALDKNSNNKIDDGLELFGTLNGNGFADLKRYDNDNNGWIDESDPIFDGLRIWQKTKDEDTLVALGEVGIGAIYLGSTDGRIDIKNERNETLGRIRSTGLFLNEDGTSGVVSQIDFARQNSPLNEFLKTI